MSPVFGTIAAGRAGAVVAINPDDYDRGRGHQRVSPLAWLLPAVNDVPVIGGTFARLRHYRMVKHVLDGGLHREGGLPPALARELYGGGSLSLVRRARGRDPEGDGVRGSAPHLRRTHS